MTVVLIVLVVALAVALAIAVVVIVAGRHETDRRRAVPSPERGAQRILFPFMADGLSRRALDAALRLARAEGATLVPVFLARVPLNLPLEGPLPRQAAICLGLQDAIEGRAAAYGVAIDSRLERGRTYRHALARTIDNERFDRLVIAAAVRGAYGFLPDDVAWLLDHAPGEILVLRPGEEDQLAAAPPRAMERNGVNGAGSARARRRATVGS